MNSEEPQKIRFRFDSRRAVALDDVGGGDFRIVAVLDPGNEESYALLSTSALETGEPFPSVAVPYHELVGRLPYMYRKRIEVVISGHPHRNGVPCCGRPTQRGKACRNQVRLSGWPCFLHRNQPLPG